MPSIVPSLTIHIATAKDRLDVEERAMKQVEASMMVSRKVQTVYRESSAQTSPWDPDYQVVQGEPNDLEILKLGFLKWRNPKQIIPSKNIELHAILFSKQVLVYPWACTRLN